MAYMIVFIILALVFSFIYRSDRLFMTF